MVELRLNFLRVISLTVLFIVSDVVTGQTRLEDHLGESTYHSVEKTMGFYENDAVLDYITRIGRKLEDQLPDNLYDFKYYLVDSPEPNAFASAGGYVFVTRGILPILDTEDELAGVLGHEFTHVLHHHSTRKMYRNMIPMILEVPGNLMGMLFPDIVGELINLPVDYAFQTADAAFSRRQEREADRYGIEFATRAGYDPAGLKSALLKLEEYVSELYHAEEHFTLFLDHPLTRNRAENLTSLQQRHHMQPRETIPVTDHLNGLIFGQNPSHGLILPDHSFLHPDMDLFMKFPENWKLDNTPEALNAMDASGLTGFAMGISRHSPYLDSLAIRMADRIKEQNYEIRISDPYELNGFTALDMIATGARIREEGITRITWIKLKKEDVVLQCVGTAHSTDQFGEIEEIISSIRPLSESEKETIVSRILYVEVGRNESLKEFASRKGSDVQENLKLIEIINRLESSDNVQGRPIKYLRTEPYFKN